MSVVRIFSPPSIGARLAKTTSPDYCTSSSHTLGGCLSLRPPQLPSVSASHRHRHIGRTLEAKTEKEKNKPATGKPHSRKRPARHHRMT